jgi:hypothetical protein
MAVLPRVLRLWPISDILSARLPVSASSVAAGLKGRRLGLFIEVYQIRLDH